MNKKRQGSSSNEPDNSHKSSVEIVIAKYGLMGTIITAVLGLLGIAVTGYFAYMETRTQVLGAIDVTRTAEANLVSPITMSTPTTSSQEASPAFTQAPAAAQDTPEAPVAAAHEIACFYYQNASQTPIEVLADTLKYSGSGSLTLANGERISFEDVGRFELLGISAGNRAVATITLVDGSALTEELKYGDSSFSGSTERSRVSIGIEDVKRIVFGQAGSCLQ